MADDAPEDWEKFCTYAKRDTEELRRVFRLMQPALTAYDWARLSGQRGGQRHRRRGRPRLLPRGRPAGQRGGDPDRAAAR